MNNQLPDYLEYMNLTKNIQKYIIVVLNIAYAKTMQKLIHYNVALNKGHVLFSQVIIGFISK